MSEQQGMLTVTVCLEAGAGFTDEELREVGALWQTIVDFTAARMEAPGYDD